MKKVPFCNLSVPVGLVSLTILAGAFLTLPNTNADDVVDQINITVPESCTVEPVVSPEHTKTVQNNQYYSGIGTTTFKTYCNDNNGYAIYAVGYSNDEIGNTLMKHNTSSSYDFNTGTATSGDTSNWAMQLSAISGTYAPTIHSDTNGTFSSYHVVPSEYTKVVSFASNTDLPATGVNAVGSGFTSTYAAWISATQPAGTYTGKVLYQLVHPMTEVPLQPQTTEAGCIRYYPNGSNVEGTMGCQSITSSDTSITLLASNFSREGYGFAGWSTTYDYSDTTGFLGPNEDISFTAGQYTGNNPGLSLYAYWVKSAGSIQNWTGCSSLQQGSVTALTDLRDSETYAVAKLADGNCWMIENLRLEAENTRSASDVALAQGYGASSVYGDFIGLANAETDFSQTYNSIYYHDTQGGGATIDIGTANYPGYRMPRYNNWNHQVSSANRPQNANGNSAINNITNAGMYSYGNYYTWHAAIADTTFYSNSESGATSICPAGWRLPIGAKSTANKSFGKLSIDLGGPEDGSSAGSSSTPSGTEMSKIFRNYPNNFIYSGYFSGSSASYRSTYGYYWSSTALGYNAHDLSINKLTVSPGTDYGSANRAQSIRCISSS